MSSLNRGQVNLALSSIACTISSAGSVLLHIIFAITIYKETNSGFLTSIFISLQWLPTLLVIIFRSDWDYGMNPIKRWYYLDLLSAVLTLPILVFASDSNYIMIVLILLIRGISDQINRINKTVCTRVMFPESKSSKYASFMQSGYHVGIGSAALLGIFISKNLDLYSVIWIDALTFIISAILMMFVQNITVDEFPSTKPQESLLQRIKRYQHALRDDGRLLFCAILPPITAAFFQGTYTVLQPIFPIVHLELNTSAVSTSYILASIAIVLGSFGFSVFNSRYDLFEKKFSYTYQLVISVSIFSCCAYLICVSTHQPFLSALTFTIMILLFEFLWMTGYVGIVAFSPKGELGSIFGISFAIGCLLASVVVTLVGFLLDKSNNDFIFTIFIFMAFYLLIIFGVWRLSRVNIATNKF